MSNAFSTDRKNIRILGFTGMKRQNSYNNALLLAAQELLPEGAELEIFSAEELPPFTGSSPESSERVETFREKLQHADALLIATPEYKGLVSNGLKNTLNWVLQGEPVISEKPAALLGIGRQDGTEQAQLRHLLTSHSVAVVAAPTVYVAAADKFDESGKLTHAETREQIRALLEILVTHARDAHAILVG